MKLHGRTESMGRLKMTGLINENWAGSPKNMREYSILSSSYQVFGVLDLVFEQKEARIRTANCSNDVSRETFLSWWVDEIFGSLERNAFGPSSARDDYLLARTTASSAQNRCFLER